MKITAQNFDVEVISSIGICIVDFYADWCGPCRMLAPNLEAAAKIREGVKIGKCNVDEENELAIKFGIVSIPFLVFYKDGVRVKDLVGYKTQGELENIIINL